MFNYWIRWFVVVILCCLILLACSSESESVIEIHPIEERTPYQGHQVQLISKNVDSVYFQNMSAKIQNLQNFLVSNEKRDATYIDSLVQNAYGSYAVSIDDRFIFMHVASNRLFEYNLGTKKIRVIAPFGRGPGDIAHAVEMKIIDDYLYVTREDFTISVFNCNLEPCEFSKVLKTSVVGSSSAVLDGRTAVLGRNIQGTTSNSIHLHDVDGEVVGSFGEVYKAESNYLQSTLMQGILESSKTLKTYLKVFNRFPFAYLLDESGKIKQIFKIEDFEQSTIEYNRVLRSVTSHLRGNISALTKVSEDQFIITVTTMHDNLDDTENAYDRSFDFYLLDIRQLKGNYLGSYHHKGDTNIAIHITDLGIVVNEGGEFRYYEGIKL